jgi:hypothetical protein
MVRVLREQPGVNRQYIVVVPVVPARRHQTGSGELTAGNCRPMRGGEVTAGSGRPMRGGEVTAGSGRPTRGVGGAVPSGRDDKSGAAGKHGDGQGNGDVTSVHWVGRNVG